MTATVAARRPHERTPGWVWLTGLVLLGLLAAFLAMTFLIGREEPSATPVPATTAGATEPAPSPGPSPQLLAGGQDMLVASGGSLAPFAGRPVEAKAVTVQSVVGDEGFWIGTSPQQRVFVQLRIDGESPFRVRQGQVVDLDGTVVKLGGDASDYGVTDDEGGALLERQGHVIEATSIRLS